MSMAGLLKRFGHDAGRWVSPTGMVSIAPAGAGGAGFRIAPHTFHGGEDPAADPHPESTDASPWWMDERAMDREREAMARVFPSFIEVPGDHDSPPAWGGSVETGRGTFPVLFIHRRDRGLPAVIPITLTRRGKSRGRGWAKAPHLYLSGHLCVADISDWDPDRLTMADVVAWTAHWHACYIEWLATDHWPSEGVPDVAA